MIKWHWRKHKIEIQTCHDILSTVMMMRRISPAGRAMLQNSQTSSRSSSRTGSQWRGTRSSSSSSSSCPASSWSSPASPSGLTLLTCPLGWSTMRPIAPESISMWAKYLYDQDGSPCSLMMAITQGSCEADVLSCYYLDALNKTEAVLLVTPLSGHCSFRSSLFSSRGALWWSRVNVWINPDCWAAWSNHCAPKLFTQVQKTTLAIIPILWILLWELITSWSQLPEAFAEAGDVRGVDLLLRHWGEWSGRELIENYSYWFTQ